MGDAERIAALERRVEALMDALASEQDRRRAVEWERDQLLAQADAGEAHRIGLEEHVGAEQLVDVPVDLPQVAGTFAKEWDGSGVTFRDLGKRGGLGTRATYAGVDKGLADKGLYTSAGYIRELKIGKATLSRWVDAGIVTPTRRPIEGLSREVQTFTQADVEMGHKLRQVQAEPGRLTLEDAAAEARRRRSAS